MAIRNAVEKQEERKTQKKNTLNAHEFEYNDEPRRRAIGQE